MVFERLFGKPQIIQKRRAAFKNGRSKMQFWKTLNSPVVVVLIALCGLFAVKTFVPRKGLSSEIRSAYEELNKIMQESVDENKSFLVKEFATEMAGQISAGFRQAFGGNKEEKSKDTQKILDVKKQLEIIDLHQVPSQWDSQEKFIGILKNNSDQYLRMIKVSSQFYDDKDKLIDINTNWISAIKILEPGEEFGLEIKRHLGNNPVIKLASTAKIKARVVSFEFVAKPD